MAVIFTTETRLSEKDCGDIIAYARSYVHEYCGIQRYVWHYIVSNHGIPDKSKFNTELQYKYGISKRTAGSIISDMGGRYKSLVALKQTELFQLRQKADSLGEKIPKLAETVNAMKKKAVCNLLTEKQLVTYRNKKKSLYYKHQRLQKLKDRIAQRETDIQNGTYRLGFGGRKMFGKQHLLTENGYQTFTKWKNNYISRRDGNIFYLGSKDETCGNQMFQLMPQPDGSYNIKIRRDGNFDNAVKYVYGKCSFKYLDNEVRNSILHHDRPVSYRLKLRGRKVYLQALIQFDTDSVPVMTTLHDGAIGLDFNNGHIDLSETDSHGNLVAMKQYPLYYHGTGGKATNEMRQVAVEIGRYALAAGKSIVKEDLSFIKKKARTAKGKSAHEKKYNKMLHTLDYSRYENCIKNMTARYGIDLLEVNPAYTSKIAEQKYCDKRKIPIHNGAAYVIARRGQGFKDKYVA